MSYQLWYRLAVLFRIELRSVRKAYRRAARRWRLRNWQKHPPERWPVGLLDITTGGGDPTSSFYATVNAQLQNALQNAYPLPQTLGQLQGIAQYQAIGRQATTAEFDAMMRNAYNAGQQSGGLGNALGNAIPGLASMIGL